jgi:hypothetical protein
MGSTGHWQRPVRGGFGSRSETLSVEDLTEVSLDSLKEGDMMTVM